MGAGEKLRQKLCALPIDDQVRPVQIKTEDNVKRVFPSSLYAIGWLEGNAGEDHSWELVCSTCNPDLGGVEMPADAK